MGTKKAIEKSSENFQKMSLGELVNEFFDTKHRLETIKSGNRSYPSRPSPSVERLYREEEQRVKEMTTELDRREKIYKTNPPYYPRPITPVAIG